MSSLGVCGGGGGCGDDNVGKRSGLRGEEEEDIHVVLCCPTIAVGRRGNHGSEGKIYIVGRRSEANRQGGEVKRVRLVSPPHNIYPFLPPTVGMPPSRNGATTLTARMPSSSLLRNPGCFPALPPSQPTPLPLIPSNDYALARALQLQEMPKPPTDDEKLAEAH